MQHERSAHVTCRSCILLAGRTCRTVAHCAWIRYHKLSEQDAAVTASRYHPPCFILVILVLLLPACLPVCSQSDAETYCGAEVSLDSAPSNGTLGDGAQYATRLRGERDWFRVEIPLTAFDCGSGSVAGGLSGVDRVDFQNTNIRDADICLDNVQIV